MSIENYSRVALLTNGYVDEGVRPGSIGYVIEVYLGEKYEVEFSGSDGIAIAQIVVSGHEIAVAD